MAYATVADMVARFGAAEMVRASTPDGADAVLLVPAPIMTALQEASVTIDTYLRKRYRVPLDLPAPSEIQRACCLMARYDLSLGGERNPSEQTKQNRDETVSWLKGIARGDMTLDLAEVAPGDESFATFQSRDQVFQDQTPSGGCFTSGGGFFTSGGVS